MKSRFIRESAPPRISDRILSLFCRQPGTPDYPGGTVKTNVENSLDFLAKTVPNFRVLPQGKVLDFGCGWGHQAVAMSKLPAVKQVTGLDIQWNDRARALAQQHGCGDRVRFLEALPAEDWGTFDMVLSCSSMEHFSDPAGMVELMRKAVRPGGIVVISFAEPWYGPRGSHFDNISKLPWVNLLFPESTVMLVRSRYRDDGATRYEDVQGGLNRMSIAKFERIIAASGMRREFFKVYPAKRIPLLGHIPVIRELSAAAVATVLRKP